MHAYPNSASTFLPDSDDSLQSQQAEDRLYQAVTVASILLLLASLWIF
jgi:hypothetical protein